MSARYSNTSSRGFEMVIETVKGSTAGRNGMWRACAGRSIKGERLRCDPTTHPLAEAGVSRAVATRGTPITDDRAAVAGPAHPTDEARRLRLRRPLVDHPERVTERGAVDQPGAHWFLATERAAQLAEDRLVPVDVDALTD